MTDFSPRHALPLLFPGQAQKDITHNEALAAIDSLLLPVVEAVFPATVPTSPLVGQCWIADAAPTGDWSGQALNLAAWTSGGWRFLTIPEGGSVWSLADGMPWRKTAGSWQKGVLSGTQIRVDGVQVIGSQQATISVPAGGTTVDAEARIAVSAILSALRSHGLIAT